MKHATLIPALAVLAAMCQADEATLPDLRKIYESRSAQIEVAYTNATATVLQQYGDAIAHAKELYRAQGDLDGLLSAGQELERLAKEQNVPSGDPKDIAPLIADARGVYLAACGTASSKKTSDLIALAQAYLSRLDILQKQYVKQNEIKAAIAVRQEAKRMDFVLADLQARPSAQTESSPSTQVPSRDPFPTPWISLLTIRPSRVDAELETDYYATSATHSPDKHRILQRPECIRKRLDTEKEWIFIHPTTRTGVASCSFAFKKPISLFRATLSCLNANGEVVFRVYNGQELIREVSVSGRDEPQEIEFNLGRCTALRLEVYRGQRPESDWALWGTPAVK